MMHTVDNILHVEITPHWEVVNKIHNKTEELIRTRNKKKIDKDSIVMVATELIENAVKYGQSRPGCPKIDFTLLMEDEYKIKITVKNGVRYEKDVDNVKEKVQQIKNTRDLKKLFEQSLLELLKSPCSKRAHLGLFRIVYEGSFSLDYSYNDEILTMTAIREF